MALTFESFNASHFSDYQSWFSDPELDRALGPVVDQEWLDCVVNDTNGCTYAVCRGGGLVAIVGLAFPDAEHPAFTITEFAVQPSLRGQGTGGDVLRLLMDLHMCGPGQTWLAFVDERNPAAKSFFEKQGWVCRSGTPNDHGMWEMRC